MKILKIISCLLISFYISLFSQTKPYVVLISFDGFRWDYMSRGISPDLEKLKQEGVSALSLRSTFPSVTFPNHLSIITGMYPEHHGIISNNFHDPYTNSNYRMSDTNAVRNAKWYLGEAFWETAERQGIITASYFWPGSELIIPYRRPTYYEKFDGNRPYEKRVQGVIDWLKLPSDKRPHFITAYFQETDHVGHEYGPNSPELNEAIKRLDGIAGLFVKKLEEINMKDSVDLIFVSDHGMTEISNERMINIEAITGSGKCKFYGDGAMMMIETPKESIRDIYEVLKAKEFHYKVYLREEIPDYFHFKDNPLISPIFITADLGWSLCTNKKSDFSLKEKGNHGYDNNQLDMHGFFVAEGPDFKKNYRTGTLWNIDIYPLLCKIFNIIPRANIDGRSERIEFILNK
jgi:ectonucleotide pyrophosphatase/phosphodiesterase family member 5